MYATAGLFTRALPFDAWTILAWRSTFAALFMVALVMLESRRFSLVDYRLDGARLVMVPITALGTICYIFALKLTTVADVMIVYATTPFVTVAVAWLWSREVPNLRTGIASAVALVGVGVMIGGADASGGRLLGAFLTFVMNITFALAIVLARRTPQVSMTPVNALGVAMAGVVGFAFAPGEAVGGGSLVLMAAFGVFTVGLALAFFMAGARLLPSGEVALLGISDTVLGPVLVWLVFGENPGSAAILGGTIVAAALIWHLSPELRRLFRHQ